MSNPYEPLPQPVELQHIVERVQARVSGMDTECWNAFCIAGDCDGTNHVDVTGDTWSQRRGTAYNPETRRYDEDGNSGPVFTVYERGTEVQQP